MKQGRAHPNYGAVDAAEAMRLRREEGLSNDQIAARFGVAPGSVWKHLGPTPDALRRNRNWDTDDTRERVRELRWRGYSVRRIAYLLGVPRSTVGGWVKSHG